MSIFPSNPLKHGVWQALLGANSCSPHRRFGAPSFLGRTSRVSQSARGELWRCEVGRRQTVWGRERYWVMGSNDFPGGESILTKVRGNLRRHFPHWSNNGTRILWFWLWGNIKFSGTRFSTINIQAGIRSWSLSEAGNPPALSMVTCPFYLMAVDPPVVFWYIDIYIYIYIINIYIHNKYIYIYIHNKYIYIHNIYIYIRWQI